MRSRQKNRGVTEIKIFSERGSVGCTLPTGHLNFCFFLNGNTRVWLLIFKTHVRKSRSHFFSVTLQSSTVTTAGVLDHFKNNLSTNTTFNILTQVYTGCFGCIWWGFFFQNFTSILS